MEGWDFARPDARTIVISLVLILAATGTAPALGAPAYPGVIEEQQPDGSVVQLRVRGDEHFNWMEDTRGFTVLKQAGWYKYAERDPNTGRLVKVPVADNPWAVEENGEWKFNDFDGRGGPGDDFRWNN